MPEYSNRATSALTSIREANIHRCPYRALCDETIAELTGVKPNLVKKWVEALSSLLYRDEEANRGIRVRHYPRKADCNEFYHQIDLTPSNKKSQSAGCRTSKSSVTSLIEGCSHLAVPGMVMRSTRA